MKFSSVQQLPQLPISKYPFVLLPPPFFFFKMFQTPGKNEQDCRKNGVMYHPTSPSGLRSKIHISVKPFMAFTVSRNFVDFSLKGANPTMVGEYFQINGVQIAGA